MSKSMRFSSSARAWNPEDENGVDRAMKTVMFEASTEAEAHFLAQLHDCFRRGIPDMRLVSTVEAVRKTGWHDLDMCKGQTDGW